jgi:hypothetical protein
MFVCFLDLKIFQIFVEFIEVFVVEKVFVDCVGDVVTGDSCGRSLRRNWRGLGRFNFLRLGLVSTLN